MRKQNFGENENDILQNQFTAYLLTAVRRQKSNYLKNKEKERCKEQLSDLKEFDMYIQIDIDFTENLSLMEQIENPLLYTALSEAKERERYIFLTRVLEERSFLELAEELGISYKASTHAYYRLIKRMRDKEGW